MRYTDNINFYDCTNDENKKFDVFLDNCGSFNTNMNVNVKRVSTKSQRDE